MVYWFTKFTSDILDVKKELVNKSDTDKKLISFNKKTTSNKTKHREADKRLTDPAKKKKLHKNQKKDYFLLARINFTGDDGYLNFLVFTPMLSFLILDSNRKFTDWISTRISSTKLNHLILALKQQCLSYLIIE